MVCGVTTEGSRRYTDANYVDIRIWVTLGGERELALFFLLVEVMQ